MTPAPAQLEIISASGHIEFFTLDPAKGITNVGSHPENDIVLRGPGIAPFHAMLDHRQHPVRIILLAQIGRTTLGGVKLVPNVSRVVHPEINIQLDGYTILLAESFRNGSNYSPQYPDFVTTPAEETYPPAGRPATFGPPTSRPESLSGMAESRVQTPPPFYGVPSSAMIVDVPPQAVARVDAVTPQLPEELTTPASDILNDVVVTEIGAREQVTDVSRTVIFRLTVINGGDIDALFKVDVIGVPLAWTTVSPPSVRLYEGDRTTITVSITPPRLPASRAGIHYLAFRVTSPNYPGQVSQRAGTLIINPYHEFSLSELTPRQQTISWFTRAGAIILSLHNQSNTPTVFQIEAEDEDRGCTFEFNVPGEPLARVGQADVRLPADTSATIPINIVPRSRQLFGLRRRHYGYRVNTGMPESALSRRSVSGELNTKALFGPVVVGMMAVVALLLATFVVWIFSPRINFFNSDGSKTRVISSGEMITLRWNASPLVNLKINPVPGDVDGPVGAATVMPTADVVYELRAENWLSRLSYDLLTASEEVRVYVTPAPSVAPAPSVPEIVFFTADPTTLVDGELPGAATENQVQLTWSVNGTVTNVEVSGPTLDSPISNLQTNGSINVTVEETTLFVLTAFHEDMKVSSSVQITVD